MGSSKRLVLVHREMSPLNLDERVNIVLTPQYYTVKKEALPVKYLHQAKRIAPSLFDGFLEVDKVFDYLVYQEGERWVFIAYCLADIQVFLAEKGLLAWTGKIFFAEQFVNCLKEPILLGEKEALSVVEGEVVVVPKHFLSTECSLSTFPSCSIPKSGVKLGSTSNDSLSLKQTLFFSTLFFLFALLFGMEALRYKQGGTQERERLAELSTEYPRLQSAIQRESIAQKYQTIDKQERLKRDAIKHLSELIFKGVDVTFLRCTTQSIEAQCECKSTKVAKRFLLLLKNSYFPHAHLNGTTIQIKENL